MKFRIIKIQKNLSEESLVDIFLTVKKCKSKLKIVNSMVFFLSVPVLFYGMGFIPGFLFFVIGCQNLSLAGRIADR